MEKKSSLGKNILVIGLGTSLSKLMSILLVGLYTAYLTKEDFGYYDILFTVITMLTPVITLQITDALYRHLLDARDDDESSRSVTCSFTVIAGGLVLSVLILCVINMVADIRMGWILPGYFVTSILFIFSQQVARGLKRNTVYAASGLVYTLVMLTSNILMIAVWGMGVEALLYSAMIADIFGILIIEFPVGAFRRLKLSAFDPELVKSMCAFSIPLLPNAVTWWGLMLLCRAVIEAFLGIDANGIYAVSAKFPALLMAVFSIFNLAWQESAITEYDSKHRDEYYSNTFNLYMKLLLSSLLVLLSVTRGMTSVLIGKEFGDAWLYVPFLYIGSVCAAFSTFYGTGYLSTKKTVGAFVTTLIGVACGSACLFLIPVIGLQAAALAQMTAYLMMFVSRAVHTRKFFRIRVDWFSMIFLSALTGIFTYCYFLANLRVEMTMLAVSIAVFVIVNRGLVKRIFGLAGKILGRKGG